MGVYRIHHNPILFNNFSFRNGLSCNTSNWGIAALASATTILAVTPNRAADGLTAETHILPRTGSANTKGMSTSWGLCFVYQSVNKKGNHNTAYRFTM